MRVGVDLTPLEYLESEYQMVAEDDNYVVLALRIEKKWLARNLYMLTHLVNVSEDYRELWPPLTRYDDDRRRLKPWNENTGLFGPRNPLQGAEPPHSPRKAQAKRPQRARPRKRSRGSRT